MLVGNVTNMRSDRTNESIFFQKNEGRDHIILSTDYVSHRKTINWCPKCIHFHQGNSDEIQKSLQLTEFAKKQKQQQQRDPSESCTGNLQFYDYIKDYNCDHHRDNNEISFNFTNDVSTTRFGLQARGVTII